MKIRRKKWVLTPKGEDYLATWTVYLMTILLGTFGTALTLTFFKAIYVLVLLHS